jgi:hypothetical protein
MDAEALKEAALSHHPQAQSQDQADPGQGWCCYAERNHQEDAIKKLKLFHQLTLFLSCWWKGNGGVELMCTLKLLLVFLWREVSGIHPGYSYKEGRKRTPSRIPLYSY